MCSFDRSFLNSLGKTEITLTFSRDYSSSVCPEHLTEQPALPHHAQQHELRSQQEAARGAGVPRTGGAGRDHGCVYMHLTL